MAVRPLLLALVGAIALGFVVEWLIVTDEEAIRALVSDAEEAFNGRQFSDLGNLMDPDFRYGPRDRDETIQYLERMSKRFQAAGADVVLSEVTVSGDEGSAQGEVRLRVLTQFSVFPVSLRFARLDGTWRLNQASLGAGGP